MRLARDTDVVNNSGDQNWVPRTVYTCQEGPGCHRPESPDEDDRDSEEEMSVMSKPMEEICCFQLLQVCGYFSGSSYKGQPHRDSCLQPYPPQPLCMCLSPSVKNEEQSEHYNSVWVQPFSTVHEPGICFYLEDEELKKSGCSVVGPCYCRRSPPLPLSRPQRAAGPSPGVDRCGA
ncbi:hypothetical protein Y1Q_0023934 [Alligator mississippiensis]|uniref:Uncharacterized protein n=1 Tax=Alligator mississippiensis TaxID=8496 RepID=A0A151NTZ6_ALLMI|nr:hypothetical protein Y1Q_0023934 [Alligator mississippiensis]